MLFASQPTLILLAFTCHVASEFDYVMSAYYRSRQSEKIRARKTKVRMDMHLFSILGNEDHFASSPLSLFVLTFLGIHLFRAKVRRRI